MVVKFWRLALLIIISDGKYTSIYVNSLNSTCNNGGFSVVTVYVYFSPRSE